MASAPAAVAASAPAAAPSSPAVPIPGQAPASEGQGAAPPIKARPILSRKPKIPGLRDWNRAPDATPEPAVEAAPTEATPEPGPTSITINGKTYTADTLQTALSSMSGRVRASDQRARSLEGEVAQLREAVQRLQQPAPQAQPQQRPAPAQSQRFVESVGEPFWNSVKGVEKQHGFEVAVAYALDKYDQSNTERIAGLEKQITEKLRASLAPQLEPILEQHTNTQNQQLATKMWAEFATYTDDATGQPLFPELASDPESQQGAALMWLALGKKYGKEFAMSEYGLYSAFRDWQAFKSYHEAQGQTAGQAAQSVLDRIEHDHQAGASLAVSAPSTPQVAAPDANPHEEQAQLKKRIRAANSGFIKGMGVRSLPPE